MDEWKNSKETAQIEAMKEAAKQAADADGDGVPDNDDEAAALVSTKEPWEKEVSLVKYEGTYDNYGSLVGSFGLVTCFVTALPLSPAILLVFTLLEMRLDALKLVMFHQRPSPKPVRYRPGVLTNELASLTLRACRT